MEFLPVIDVLLPTLCGLVALPLSALSTLSLLSPLSALSPWWRSGEPLLDLFLRSNSFSHLSSSRRSPATFRNYNITRVLGFMLRTPPHLGLGRKISMQDPLEGHTQKHKLCLGETSKCCFIKHFFHPSVFISFSQISDTNISYCKWSKY